MVVETASLHVKLLDEATVFSFAPLARENPTAVTEVEKRRGLVQHYPVLQPLDGASAPQHLFPSPLGVQDWPQETNSLA